jgi:hypothetical protein
MYKLAIAVAVTVILGALPISAHATDVWPDGHHRHVRAGAFTGESDGFVSNGAFDWRHRRYGWDAPWYSHGYSRDCFAWTPHAYHYACDPNSRY